METKPQFAFPATHECMNDQRGMTLRDYFAAAALTGMCSLESMADWANGAVATECYEIADAMLKQRGEA